MRHLISPAARTGFLAAVAFAVVLGSGAVHAADVFWTNNAGGGDGNWGTGTNWSTGSVPGTGDRAVFSDNATDAGASTDACLVNVNVNVGGVLIKAGYGSTITMGAGFTFLVQTQHFEMNSGAFVGADGQISMGDFSTDNTELRILGGTFTASSNTTIIRHDFLVQGTGAFVHNSGTVDFIAAGDANNIWTFDSNVTINNLNVSKGSHDLNMNSSLGDLIVQGDIFITSWGRFFGGTIQVQGNVDGLDGLVYGDGTFIINGAGDQQIGNSSGGSLGMGGFHEVNKATGFLTYINTIVITQNFTVTDGGDSVITTGSTFVFDDTGSVSSNITVNNATTGFEFGNLVFNKGGGHNARFVDDVIINGDFTVLSDNNISTSASAPGPTVQIFGSLEINDATIASFATLELVGTNNQAITIQTGTATPADLPSGLLVINKTGGMAFLAALLDPASTSSTCSLIVREGTFFCNGFGVAMGGTITVEDGGNLQLVGNESISPSTSPNFTLDPGSLVTYVGDGDATQDTFTMKNYSYKNLTIADGSAGADIFNMAANLTVAEDLTLSGGSLDATASNFDVNITGDWTEAGGVFVPRGADVEFKDNSVASTISGATTFFDFTCIAAGKTLTFEAGTTQNITGTLTLTGASGNQIVLNSTSPGTTWRIRTQDDEFTRDVSFVNVTDSVNLGIPMIFTNPPNDPTGSTDGGNTFNWFTDITPVNLTLDSVTPTHIQGNTWDIQVTTADGFVPYTYLWTTGTGGVTFGTGTAEDTTVNLTGAAADTVITVTITVTDDNGFTDSIDIPLIRTSTALDVTASGTPAAGSESTGNVWDITSTASGGVPVPGQSAPDDYIYTWTGPAGVVFGNANLPTTTADLTGAAADTDLTLTITVEDLFGTTDSFDITVYRSSTGVSAVATAVYATPPVPDPFTPDVIVVTGTLNAFTLTGVLSDATGPITASSELWNDLTTPSPAFSTANPVTVDAPGTAGTYIYEYRGTDSHGLIGIGTVDVYVVDPIVPNPAANPPILDLFTNTSTNLTVTPTGGAPDAAFGTYTVEWLDLDTNTPIADPTNYAPTGLGLHTVQVTVTDELGNIGVATLGIPLIESALTIVATGTQNFGGTVVSGNNLVGFAGGTLVLTSTPGGGTGTYEFLWTGPNGFTTTVEDPGAVVLPFAPGIYVYTVELTDPLLGQTVSDTVTIEVFESINNQGLFVGNGKCKYKATTASTPEKGKDYAKIWLEGVVFNTGDRVAFDFNGRPIGDIAGGSSIVLDDKLKGKGQLGPLFGPNFFPKVTVKYKATRIRLDAKCMKGDFDPFSQGAPMASAVTGLSTVVNVTIFVDRAPADNVVDETIVLPLMFKVRAKLSPSGVFTESGKKIAP